MFHTDKSTDDSMSYSYNKGVYVNMLANLP